MKIKIEITNEDSSSPIRIWNDITVEGFKFALKENPKVLLEFIKTMEEQLRPKRSGETGCTCHNDYPMVLV